jgi:thiamine-monophosphate kinase
MAKGRKTNRQVRGQAGESGEEQLISRFFRPIATDPGALGLRDDTALWTPPPGCEVVLKTDAIVGGIHFLPADPADAVAQKALRVNLSDLAAKGAKPAGFLLALAIPKNVKEPWLASFARGLAKDAAEFGCPLLGGDTDRTTGPVTVSIAALGHLPQGTMVRRGRARAGDLVFVSGTIGDAALGLLLRRTPKRPAFRKLSAGEKSHLNARYLLPQPRLALAGVLREFATAAIDVSDGLVGDLAKLARESGLGARVEAAHVPLSPAARKAVAGEPALLAAAISGGDDYEIVCTVPEARGVEFQKRASAAGVGVRPIGRMRAGDGVEVIGFDGKRIELARSAYSHF